jgi:hypothetical protein
MWNVHKCLKKSTEAEAEVLHMWTCREILENTGGLSQHPNIMPAAIKGVDWEAVKALVISGVTYADIARRPEFKGISEDAIYQRARRGNWKAIVAKARQISEDMLAEHIGESMAQKGAKHRERVFEEVEKSLETIAKLKPAKKRSEILQHEEILKLHANTFMKVTGLDQPNVGTFNVAFTMNVQEIALPSEQTAEKQAQVVDIEASASEIEDRQ